MPTMVVDAGGVTHTFTPVMFHLSEYCTVCVGESPCTVAITSPNFLTEYQCTKCAESTAGQIPCIAYSF